MRSIIQLATSSLVEFKQYAIILKYESRFVSPNCSGKRKQERMKKERIKERQMMKERDKER